MLLAISAGATLILAIAAFWAIWQTRDIQKKERRERLLNEIIKWLKELQDHVLHFNVSILRELQEDADLMMKAQLPRETAESLRNTELTVANMSSLRREIREGEYNQKVALGLDKGLGGLVEITLDHLRKRRELILEDSKHPRPTPTSIDEIRTGITDLLKEDTELSRNAGAIKESVANTINKAIEIKISLIQ